MFSHALVPPGIPAWGSARGAGIRVSTVRGTRTGGSVHALKWDSESVLVRRYSAPDEVNPVQKVPQAQDGVT